MGLKYCNVQKTYTEYYIIIWSTYREKILEALDVQHA